HTETQHTDTHNRTSTHPLSRTDTHKDTRLPFCRLIHLLLAARRVIMVCVHRRSPVSIPSPGPKSSLSGELILLMQFQSSLGQPVALMSEVMCAYACNGIR